MNPFFMSFITADDVEEAERDLAFLMQQHAEETDPEARAMLAEWIESDTAWLAEMREAVYPTLRLMLPLGLPAPGPMWGVGR